MKSFLRDSVLKGRPPGRTTKTERGRKGAIKSPLVKLKSFIKWRLWTLGFQPMVPLTKKGLLETPGAAIACPKGVATALACP